MHVDPDRLLFMFDERILIFLTSDSFYLPSVKTPKMAANPLKKTEIRRYTTEVPAFRPFFQRYGWTLCIMGKAVYIQICQSSSYTYRCNNVNIMASKSFCFRRVVHVNKSKCIAILDNYHQPCEIKVFQTRTGFLVNTTMYICN